MNRVDTCGAFLAALLLVCCGVGCTDQATTPPALEEQPAPAADRGHPARPTKPAAPVPPSQVRVSPAPHSPVVQKIEDLLQASASSSGDERRGLLRKGETFCRDYLAEKPTDTNLETATVCDLLVNFLWLQSHGKGSEIREVAWRSVEIKRQRLAREDPELAASLTTLATLFLVVGEYAEAKTHFYEAHGILEGHAETQPLALANCKNNLGGLFQRVGDYAKARTHFENALAIRERHLTPHDPTVVSTRNNLGQLLHEIGKTAGRRAILEEARAVFEKAEQGWTHEGFQAPHQASSGLSNYAALLYSLGEKELTRSKLKQAIKIREKEWGEEHDDLAWSLGHLARLEAEQGNLVEAERLHQRAIKIRRKASKESENAPHLSWDLKRYSQFLLAAGRPTEALTEARKAESFRRAHLRFNLPRLSEELALSATSNAYSGLEESLDAACQTQVVAHIEAAWDEVVRSRALVLDEMAARQRGIYETGGGEEVERLVDKLEDARRTVAELLVRGTQDEILETARRQREHAEEALAEASRPFRDSLERFAGSWSVVQADLPLGWALVSFVHFERRLGHGPNDSTPEYAAFVLPKRGASPRLIPLGSASALDSSCDEWLTELKRAAGMPRNDLARATTELAKRGTRVRTLLWDPIAAHLAGVQRVFVIPAARLHRVPLAVLPTDAGRYLIETGPLIHYLATERDAIQRGTTQEAGRGLLTLGGADFERSARGQSSEASPSPAHDATRSFAQDATRGVGQLSASGPSTKRPRHQDDCLAEHLRFPPLKTTREESEAVAQLWSHSSFHAEPITALRGPLATEDAFKELAPGHRILHLATHGFFLDASCAGEAEDQKMTAPHRLTGEAPRASENPLALSGIALAGANRRGRSTSDADDGIVLAEEIASLDLSGVDLAVLSACETGLGVLEKGEGVLGLRRAFQVAGVRALVMALWTIDDAATTTWMRAFFLHLLANHATTPEAMRAASLELLEAGRRGASQTAHPFFWGSFVAAGRWE